MADLETWTNEEEGLNARAKLLLDADQIVNGDRNVTYGDPNADFARTARLWNAYLDGKAERDVVDIEPADVAIMMILLKVSRLTWSPTKRDHWLDIAGYAACGADCVAASLD